MQKKVSDQMFIEDYKFMKRAIALSRQGCYTKDCGPFGCVIVRDGVAIGEGYNQVGKLADPSAHGEIVAIKNTCENIKTFNLFKCTVYTSSQPCPMCFGAILWSKADRVVYANTQQQVFEYGLGDITRTVAFERKNLEEKITYDHMPLDDALQVLKEWKENHDKNKG